VRHQTADEVDVAAKPVQLGDDDGRLALLGDLQRCGELRPAIQRIPPFAGLDLCDVSTS
jgi:hypothetical protein